MKQKGLILCIAALSLGSCGIVASRHDSSGASSSSSASLTSSSPASTDSSSVSSSDSVEAPEGDYKDFFGLEAAPRFTIEGKPEVFRFISERQSASLQTFNDAYLPVTIHMDYQGKTYTFEEAGLRMKGNTSRRRFFSESNEFTSAVHFKVNLKATFDSDIYNDPEISAFRKDWTGLDAERKLRKDRNFLGVEKFDLKYVPRNQYGGGQCVLREAYAYQAFEEAGLYAPMATLTSVKLKCGDATLNYVCELIESIDKEFLKRRLGKNEAKGDLYKCVYNGMGKADFSRSGAVEKDGDHAGERIPSGKIGVEDNYIHYAPCYQLKTNDDLGEESDFSKMADLIMTLWGCVYGGQGKEALESKVDMEQFLRFSAVSFLLGNFDDQRYNTNNFYTYFQPSDGKAIFIPYDWDWCLGLDLERDLATRGPLDSWTLEGQQSNLYAATIIDKGNVSYSLTDYQSEYLTDVTDLKDDVLDAEKYHAFATLFGQENTDETADVLNYMAVKRAHCA